MLLAVAVGRGAQAAKVRMPDIRIDSGPLLHHF
jgi:hypothetical protein